MRYASLLALTHLCIVCYSQISLLTRQPYIQATTHFSTIVRWRTDVAEVGKVYYGSTLSTLNSVVQDTVATTEHELLIPSLSASTKYFYKIAGANRDLTTPDSSYYFRTFPVWGSNEPVNIWIAGDIGANLTAETQVKNSYIAHMSGKRTDMLLLLGDNAYYDGLDVEYQTYVFNVYGDVLRNTTTFSTPGNHDYNMLDVNTHDCAYYQNFSFNTKGESGGVPSGTEHYYSFDYGNVHIVSLNSEWWNYYSDTNSVMGNWLKADLASTSAKWKIVMWHRPAYSKGSHDSDVLTDGMTYMRQNFNPILERNGVDVVFAGHSHCYERSYLIKGHYGVSTTFDSTTMMVNSTSGNEANGTPYIKYLNGCNRNIGTVYSVVGSSGALSNVGALNHPANYIGFKDRQLSVALSIDGIRLQVKTIDLLGNIIDDYSILKVDSGYTGIADLNDIQFNVFPNPVNSELFIKAGIATGESALLEMQDSNCRTVWQGHLSGNANGIMSLPVSNFAAGLYYMHLTTAKGKTYKKVVVE